MAAPSAGKCKRECRERMKTFPVAVWEVGTVCMYVCVCAERERRKRFGAVWVGWVGLVGLEGG